MQEYNCFSCGPGYTEVVVASGTYNHNVCNDIIPYYMKKTSTIPHRQGADRSI
jgi:hypothetical protein